MAKKLPRISIVIPAYNEEQDIVTCIQALMQQTYPAELFTILLVNNNSTDNTEKLAKQLGVSVITEKKQGYIHALNTGLQAAQGDILAVTDADTVVPSDWLERIATIFQDASVVGVTGALKLDITSPLLHVCLVTLYNLFQYTNFLLHKPHLVGPNMALRKSAFTTLKSLDTRYALGGDVEIGLRLKKLGKVVYRKDLVVKTSTRRFQGDIKNFLSEALKFTIAYFYTLFFLKPPPNFNYYKHKQL